MGRLLLVVVSALLMASAAFATSVVIDGQTHCVSAPGLLSNWVEFAVGAGTHAFTLLDSDLGSSAGAGNSMVFVYGDQLDPSSADHWFFSLNGIGDSAEVSFLAGGRVFVGFVDSGSSDNEGGSLLGISSFAQPIYVDGVTNCAEVPALFSGFLNTSGCGSGNYTLTLADSDFGSSAGAESHMAFVLCDQMEASSSDFWLFTLNGVGDANMFSMGYGANFYLGFVDTGCSDNHGTSTIDIEGDCLTPVSESSWGVVKTLYR